MWFILSEVVLSYENKHGSCIKTILKFMVVVMVLAAAAINYVGTVVTDYLKYL